MKALVVDDSEMVRKIITSLLEELGFETVEAENGVEAIEKSLEHKIDVFVVDINMPLLDGITLIKRLRKTEKYKNTPIVIISTDSDASDVKRGLEAGANWYFTKPVNPKEFVQKIKELTIKRASQDEITEVAKEEGMITMLEDGFIKAARGFTTIEEVLRVTKE